MSYSDEIQSILSKPTCTVDEAVRVLGVGRRQGYEAVKRGDIPSIRLGGRILIPTKKLTDFIEGTTA